MEQYKEKTIFLWKILVSFWFCSKFLEVPLGYHCTVLSFSANISAESDIWPCASLPTFVFIKCKPSESICDGQSMFLNPWCGLNFRRRGWLRWGPAEEGTALARGSSQPAVISGEVAVRSCTCISCGDVLKVCAASSSRKLWAPETTPEPWNCSGQNCSPSPSASILSCPVTLPFLYSV